MGKAMAERVCPWWLGYAFVSPVRRWFSEDPEKLLAPYLQPGMVVLEPGPGMGFFTLPMARLVGPAGRVVVVDIQQKMLQGLERRARKAGLHERIEMRLAKPDRMELDSLRGVVDFVLAFAVVHELGDPARFFKDAAAALKPGGQLLLAEPRGHVSAKAFGETLTLATQAGFEVASEPHIRRSRSAALALRRKDVG